MNFGYEGKEDKEIIKRYSKDSDKIVINFLDGSQYEIPYTCHNEEKLLDDMIEQAIERNQKATNQQSEMKKKAIKAVFWYTVLAMGSGGVYYLNNNVNEIYKEIKEDFCKGYIIEEWIEQHPVLSDIFPDAVNC